MRLAHLVSLAVIAHTVTVRSAHMVTALAVVLEIAQTVVRVHSVTAMTAHALHVHQAKAR